MEKGVCFGDPLKAQTFWNNTIRTLGETTRHRKGEKCEESIFRSIPGGRGKHVLHKGSLLQESWREWAWAVQPICPSNLINQVSDSLETEASVFGYRCPYTWKKIWEMEDKNSPGKNNAWYNWLGVCLLTDSNSLGLPPWNYCDFWNAIIGICIQIIQSHYHRQSFSFLPQMANRLTWPWFSRSPSKV